METVRAGRITIMRTEVLKNPEPVVPRLRRITDNGETEETALESLPFTIGRSSDCDLCIESPKVSRKHAAIESLGNRFQIRDLGSTNGTLVNGQRAEKADLNDGDIVVIADLEFSFLAAAGADRLDTVTMAIDARRGAESSDDTPRQLIQDIRRIHEMLTHRGVRCSVSPIVDLHSQTLFGFQASDPFQDELPQASTGARAILATDCRIAEQLCYLNRLIAAEESLQYPDHTNLFLRVHQSEFGGNSLIDSLESVAEILADRHQLVVTVPSAAVGLTSYFTEFRARLSGIGALVAFDHFEAGPAQLGQWADAPPDFLKLAPSLTLDIAQERQRRRLLTWLLDAAAERHIRVISTGLKDEAEVQLHRELGCRLGEGPVFGSQPVSIAFSDVKFAPPHAELVTVE